MKNCNKALCVILLLFSFTTFANKEQQKQFSLEELTIADLHAAMKKQITCVSLIKDYLTRIKRYNLSAFNQAPLNAFTEINNNALRQAQVLDDFYAKSKELKGPLHCVPIIVKDNINTYDMSTTSGSLALLGNQPNRDAFIVTQLRKAGAIILGKGGMDELASGVFGISSRSGRIGNAYNTSKNPGGSSSGPAVAVSANFAMVGIGTDNSGSVRIPAAFNNLYGLRPSTGLISQQGIFPAGDLDGVAGPLTRTVEDLVRVLDVIAKQDSQDKKTHPVPRIATYTIYLNEKGLQDKRIGIVKGVGPFDTFKGIPADIQQIYQQALEKMQQAGAIIIDDIRLPKFNNNRKFNMAGTLESVDQYLAEFPAVRKNFKDICQSDRTRVYGTMSQCVKFIENLPNRFGERYQQVLQIFAANKKYVEDFMKEHQLDVLLLPISRLGEATYDAYAINTWLAPVASNAGLPAITLNLGYSQPANLPVGVELIGKQFAEGTLIEMAYAYEQISAPRQVPTLVASQVNLEKLDSPAYNNLLTAIGYHSYVDVLRQKQTKKLAVIAEILTPEKFQAMVNNVIPAFLDQ